MPAIKTFNSLIFIPHSILQEMRHANMEFKNGTQISVVAGGILHGGNNELYEIAIVKEGEFDMDSPIGWQTPKQITEIMSRLQE